MSASMIHDYIAEEFNREVIVLDYGFVSYKVIGPELLIGDMFIKKERRGEKLAPELSRACEKIGLEKGCTYMSCNVFIDDERPEYTTEKVRKLIGARFSILRTVNNQIIMVKELKGE